MLEVNGVTEQREDLVASTSPTKSPHHLIPILDNGMFYLLNIILLDFIFLTLLVHPIVEDLKKKLRGKDMVLTDIRLEADTDGNT